MLVYSRTSSNQSAADVQAILGDEAPSHAYNNRGNGNSMVGPMVDEMNDWSLSCSHLHSETASIAQLVCLAVVLMGGIGCILYNG